MNPDELLIRIDERVNNLGTKMDKLETTVAQRLDKQDAYIEKLPTWRHVAIGGGTSIISIGGWLAHMFLGLPARKP